MDFHSLARRDLQALCKLNAIPANITNLAMADALQSLHIVEGIEDFLNRSPERKAVTAAKGRMTISRTKQPIEGDESQPMTRRTTRRVSDEIMEESKTPAVRSRKTEKREEGIENLEKRDVTDTPVVATYSRRNQVARRTNLKEVSTVQRVYSTRRSARLTEKSTVPESVPMEEENEEKIDSLATELSNIHLGHNNKTLSDAEVVLQESVEKSDVVVLETVNNEALDELDVVQEDNTKTLMIENEEEGDVQEEIVDELGEKSEQPHESQFVADSLMIKNEDEKVLGYLMDNENPREQTKSVEAAPESGTKLKEDQDSKVKKSLMDDNPHEQLRSGAGEEYESNKNMESVVLAIVKLSDGDDSYPVDHMTCSDDSKAEILNSNDSKENADQTEVSSISSGENGDEMDSDKSSTYEVEPFIGDSELLQHMTCFEESKDEILNNNYLKEFATGTDISSIAPFVSSGGAENKPVIKTPSVKGGLNSVSDDKENIDRNGIKLGPTKEEAKKNKKEMAPAAITNELHAKSLRELTKMLKEKLQISNNTAEEIGKMMKERPALQKLEDNCQR